MLLGKLPDIRNTRSGQDLIAIGVEQGIEKGIEKGIEQGKLVAFISHGGWIPISANILAGKRATGSLGIKDDLENAGAIWVDAPVVVDGNLVSSRTPKDLAPFARAMVDFLQTPRPR